MIIESAKAGRWLYD
ncbi:DUF1493 family protein [Enterobacter vonholyi]